MNQLWYARRPISCPIAISLSLYYSLITRPLANHESVPHVSLKLAQSFTYNAAYPDRLTFSSVLHWSFD